MVVALELMRERVVRETERRLAGDVLAEALGGRLDAEELRRPPASPSGSASEAAVLVFDLDDPACRRGRSRRRGSRRSGLPRWSRPTAPPVAPLLCAVVEPAMARPDRARRARAASRCWARTAPSGLRPAGAVAVGSLRRAFHEARCALEATATRRTATRPTSPRTTTSAPSPCCSRSRTTTRCALYCDEPARADRADRGRVRRRAAALARGLHRAQRPVGAGRARRSTATGTRSATGSARSRS